MAFIVKLLGEEMIAFAVLFVQWLGMHLWDLVLNPRASCSILESHAPVFENSDFHKF